MDVSRGERLGWYAPKLGKRRLAVNMSLRRYGRIQFAFELSGRKCLKIEMSTAHVEIEFNQGSPQVLLFMSADHEAPFPHLIMADTTTKLLRQEYDVVAVAEAPH